VMSGEESGIFSGICVARVFNPCPWLNRHGLETRATRVRIVKGGVGGYTFSARASDKFLSTPRPFPHE
jgi:hypothetical protein